MHLARKVLRLAPSSFCSSAPTLQVSAFCLAVTAAAAGVATSSRGRRAVRASSRGMVGLLIGSRGTIARIFWAESPQRGRNIAAVHGGDVGGGFQRQRLRQEGLRHVLRG